MTILLIVSLPIVGNSLTDRADFVAENESDSNSKVNEVDMGIWGEDGNKVNQNKEEFDSKPAPVELSIENNIKGGYEDKNENSESGGGWNFLGVILILIGFYSMNPKKDGRFTTGFRNNEEPNYKLGLVLLFIGFLLLMI
jgi:hypothetical protein